MNPKELKLIAESAKRKTQSDSTELRLSPQEQAEVDALEAEKLYFEVESGANQAAKEGETSFVIPHHIERNYEMEHDAAVAAGLRGQLHVLAQRENGPEQILAGKYLLLYERLKLEGFKPKLYLNDNCGSVDWWEIQISWA